MNARKELLERILRKCDEVEAEYFFVKNKSIPDLYIKVSPGKVGIMREFFHLCFFGSVDKRKSRNDAALFVLRNNSSVIMIESSAEFGESLFGKNEILPAEAAKELF